MYGVGMASTADPFEVLWELIQTSGPTLIYEPKSVHVKINVYLDSSRDFPRAGKANLGAH
jgi:hypothetical protein